MLYIQPLNEYTFSLKSKKLEGLARLTKLGIPTVSHLFIVLPSLYKEFLSTSKLSEVAISELQLIFNSILKLGKTVTLRNSIYEKGNPAISFCVHNSLNLIKIDDFLKKIIRGYKRAKLMSLDPDRVEFCYLIQAFYSSEKCGVLLSNVNNKMIFIQAILGQTSDLLIRDDIEPDEFMVSKGTYRIINQKIATKQFRIKKLKSGITKIRVKNAEQNDSVLNTQQIINLAKYSQVVERTFGPQEMEWAVLDDNQIIFQETRDLSQAKNIKFIEQAEIVFPSEIQGNVLNLNIVKQKMNLSSKIIITSNLNISFINKLAFLYRPRAVILTKGSLTSHAATILREAKLTTVLIKNVSFRDGELVKIEKDGVIHKYYEKNSLEQ